VVFLKDLVTEREAVFECECVCVCVGALSFVQKVSHFDKKRKSKARTNSPSLRITSIKEEEHK